jgi:AcrR family transcriptional regulator
MSDDEKRRRIVDAVLSVVDKHGVQGTTTARIAATAGVSEPTLYRTFRNRRDMLLAAADKIWEQRHAELEFFESSDALDYLKKTCASHTVGIQNTQIVRFLTELSVAHTSDGLPEHIRELFLCEVQHLADLVDLGKAQGSIKPGIDTSEAAWRIMAVYWVEAMARLHGLENEVLSGFSTRRFNTILDDIAANLEPVAPTADS